MTKRKKLKEKDLLQSMSNYFWNMLGKTGDVRQLINQNKKETMDFIVHLEETTDYSVEDILEILRISPQKFFNIKTAERCSATLSKNCLKIRPNQLTIEEQKLLISILDDPYYEHFYVSYIWADAQRKYKLMISLYTFYRYTFMHRGYIRKPKPIKKIETTRVYSSFPFEKLHMDSTQIKCDNGERVMIHIVMDNYSRKILGAVANQSMKSIDVAENVIRVIKSFKLEYRDILIFCDDGSENKTFVKELLKKENIRVKKIVANHNTRITNNMIESLNNRFKNFVLKRYGKHSLKHIKVYLEEMIDFYNNLKMPMNNNLSPNEVSQGVTVADLCTKEDMELAQRKRWEINSNYECSLRNTDWRTNFVCPISEK